MNTTDDTTLLPAEEILLDQRLDEARRGLAAITAPAELESTLVRRFREHSRKSNRPRLWWVPPLALAATFALVSWMVRAPLAPLVPIAAAPAAVDDTTPFLALKPLERIALEPTTTLVTTEFPRALLADWGLPVPPERAGEPVRAEMLYSREGEPLAVRLLN